MSVNLSSINFYLISGIECFITRPATLVFITFYITNILLLLPLCIFILYLGLQQRRSTSTAAMTSHSDSFTYHMVAMELIGVFGCILILCGLYRDHVIVSFVGFCLWSFTWYGETYFQILTCVERYLAVVHPITYLSLRRERGIRIRNISIGCIWLICFGETSLMTLENVCLIIDFSLLIFSLIIISFCSLSVLCVLIRPGPGEQGRERERVDQSKQRAFYTIVAILGVLLLRCVWNLVLGVLTMSIGNSYCVMMSCGLWFNLPGSLVLPLHFLHRAGTLWCRKNNAT
ncbi:uncharacterized protein LOC123980659 [Micropterus dolomieu]|uniref:uncharacterized protein LOC123980659 n=1 Tax=Micropterus dolomieu TaxID=147949 RepID=UPI001E8EA92A|nr:uncharacterized protein LOC123980659 [Micropterus dolomieu]